MEAKECAKVLFNSGITQKEIAEILSKAEKTIGLWVKQGEWDKKRAEYALQRETAEEKVWGLINYQLKVIERIKDLQELELNKTLTVK